MNAEEPEGETRRAPEGKGDRRVPAPRERRSGKERRDAEAAAASAAATAEAEDRRLADRRTGLDRRRPHLHYDALAPHPRPERNINDYPLSTDEVEFINAINDYKAKFGRPFPTWSEVLHVMRALGYRRADALLPPGVDMDSIVPSMPDPPGKKDPP
jgi:hypothetical protein